MKSGGSYRILLVTAPDLKCARKLAKTALKSRLVACANLIPKVESHYWWRNKLEKSGEVLILFKTIRAQLAPLERLILEHHPYDTPEIIAVPLADGTPRYLSWIDQSVR